MSIPEAKTVPVVICSLRVKICSSSSLTLNSFCLITYLQSSSSDLFYWSFPLHLISKDSSCSFTSMISRWSWLFSPTTLSFSFLRGIIACSANSSFRFRSRFWSLIHRKPSVVLRKSLSSFSTRAVLSIPKGWK